MKFLTIFAVAALSSLASPILANEAQHCLTIPNDLDRLTCYDAALGHLPKQEIHTSVSNWSIRSETSEFKDTVDVFMHVESQDPVACGFSGSRKIRLYARCVENTTALILATHCHVASGFHGYGKVEYRIDDRPAKTRGFDESTNNRSLGLWNGRASIPVIRSLFGAKTLLVRFTPFNENPVTAKFDVSGLEKAITPLRNSCNW